MQMYMYIHISFFLFFSICLTASDGQRAKGNEHSAGIRPGEPSPSGTFHSERQAPFKFHFFAFHPPQQPHLYHFISSLLLACLPVCLFVSLLFFLLVVSCSCGIPFYDFPVYLLPSLLLSLLCCCYFSPPPLHLSLSLSLSSFAST